MIQAIIFDCFGVLATDNWLQFKREKFGHDPKKFARATELNHIVDAGLMSDDDYIQEIAAMASIEPEPVRRMLRTVVPNEPVVALLPMLKKRYKIGMLSNISSDWILQLFTPETIALFDALTLSYQTGFPKPDPRAYHTAAEQLGVPREQCVFIDDVEQNVTVAKEQGMQGIWYTDSTQLTRELAKQGISILRYS